MKEIKFLDPSIERKKKITNKNFQLIEGTSIPLLQKLKSASREYVIENVRFAKKRSKL